MSQRSLDARVAAVRRRTALGVFAVGSPLALATLAVFARIGEPVLAAVAVLVACGVLAWRVRVAMRSFTHADLVRRLDHALPALEDSTGLLLADPERLNAVQQLQRMRVLQRFATLALPDVRPAWPRRRIVAAWIVAILVATLVLALPERNVPGPTASPAVQAGDVDVTVTRIVAATVQVEPPRYTGLPARRESNLQTRAPAGSHLRWTLRLDPAPHAATLSFHDGTRVALEREADEWTGSHTLSASVLYRIDIAGAPALAHDEDRLYRIDADADQAPQIRVLEPEHTLTVLAAGRADWDFAFEASDDYGIAAARLTLTLAQGSGEQIAVSERAIPVRPLDATGDPRLRRYRQRLDLAALGFAQGDDLIVRADVTDTREPVANVARSASFILRWPAAMAADADGIEGIVQKVMPAYFRSQRQIIIDTEALIAERAQLDEAHHLARSDAIGVDQKILRLRYGQFLGEEFESGNPAVAAEHDDDDADGEGTSHDGHVHDGSPAAQMPVETAGSVAAILAEYGHSHDHAEAATLLDPQTRRILKAALQEMWQAELHLRMGEPRKALPYEIRALDYIKQIQQSTRIYLARVGLELPPVDEARRLSGDRAGISDRRAPPLALERDESPVHAWHVALEAGQLADPAALDAWISEHGASLDDALGLIAALDSVRRDPGCAECRARLQDRLWPLLDVPAAGVLLRKAADRQGRAYLDALATGQGR